MVKEDQLVLLKNDLQRWNILRTPISLRSVSMLEDIDLRGVDLRGAKLVDAELYAANLSNANLSGARIVNANLGLAHLYGANLSGADLNYANLKQSRLNNANFSRASLAHTDLEEANLNEANLSEANLNKASLLRAALVGVNLNNANLNGAHLFAASLDYADLSDADLSGADLRSADLNGAKLVRTNLADSNFLYARVGNTIFGSLDLSNIRRLKDVIHDAPSVIGTDTLIKSEGKIPSIFLQGCGLSDWEIEEAKLYNPDLGNDEVNTILYKIYDLRATQALQISPLFISYNHGDDLFVDKLETFLTKKGVRFWRDKHDLKAGRIEKQIDRAIFQNPTVLLVLSENSLSSDWVEHEVRTARALEKDIGCDVLCPIALDDSWINSKWEKSLMEQVMKYHILDFSEWNDDTRFKITFKKLIEGLNLFYKG